MNCCDDNGRCTGGTGCAARASTTGRGCTHDCSEGRACTCGPQLVRGGVFERHDTAGMGAGARAGQALLAPGVVEGYKAPVFGSAAKRRELRRWMWGALAWSAVCGLGGLAAGVMVGLLP